MAAYVVLKGPADSEGGDKLAFVRDGFTWLAFLIPVLWLLWHALWIEATLAVAATLLLSALGEWSGLGVYASLLSILVSLFFGLEAASLRVRALTRRGWQEWGVVEAARLDEAELIYAARADDDDTVDDALPPKPVPSPSPAARPTTTRPSLGLVPYAGRS